MGERQYLTALEVDLADNTAAFYRLVATLHRKQIDFSSLVYSRGHAIVVLCGDLRSLDLLVATVEREATVVRVEVLEGPSIDAAVDRFVPRGDQHDDE
jgi:hypothetical protein